MSEQNVALRSRPWFIVLLLIFFFPVGLILMWIQEPKSPILGKTAVRVVITIFFALAVLGNIASPPPPKADVAPTENAVDPGQAAAVAPAPAPEPVQAAAPAEPAKPKGITRETYDFIKVGMAKEEVEAMLGKATTVSTTETPGVGTIDMYQWSDMGFGNIKSITVFFNGGKVTDKNWTEM